MPANVPVIRPRLSLPDTELILEALEELGYAARDIDKMKQCTELAARIRTSAASSGHAIRD